MLAPILQLVLAQFNNNLNKSIIYHLKIKYLYLLLLLFNLYHFSSLIYIQMCKLYNIYNLLNFILNFYFKQYDILHSNNNYLFLIYHHYNVMEPSQVLMLYNPLELNNYNQKI